MMSASFIVLGVSVFFLLLVPFIGEASHGAKRFNEKDYAAQLSELEL